MRIQVKVENHPFLVHGRHWLDVMDNVERGNWARTQHTTTTNLESATEMHFLVLQTFICFNRKTINSDHCMWFLSTRQANTPSVFIYMSY